ncbi:hypothetical protein ACS0TY_035000 [Phlomoides rotata]
MSECWSKGGNTNAATPESRAVVLSSRDTSGGGSCSAFSPPPQLPPSSCSVLWILSYIYCNN